MLPLAASDPIQVGPDEYLELREAMNDVLLDLLDDLDLIAAGLAVAEVAGTPEVSRGSGQSDRAVSSMKRRNPGDVAVAKDRSGVFAIHHT